MAKEYIEREAVFDHLAFCRMEAPETKVERVTGVVRTKDILAIPAADVVEVRHGHWMIESEVHRYGLEDDVDEEFYLKCSECGREVWGIDYMKVQNGKDEEIFADYPYCHCGAKMDGEENDNAQTD